MLSINKPKSKHFERIGQEITKDEDLEIGSFLEECHDSPDPILENDKPEKKPCFYWTILCVPLIMCMLFIPLFILFSHNKAKYPYNSIIAGLNFVILDSSTI